MDTVVNRMKRLGSNSISSGTGSNPSKPIYPFYKSFWDISTKLFPLVENLCNQFITKI